MGENYWNANHRETPQFSDDKNGRVHAEMYAMTISKHRDSEKEVRPKLAGEIGTLSALMTAHLSTLEP